MSPTKKITVTDTEITISSNKGYDDYISLTDMIRAKDGDFFITDWLRNRNTIEFLGEWEAIYNPNFNYGEFAIIKSQAGLNSYKISVKEWSEKTGAIGLTAKTGRYGGTYAHKDIAFQFGMWISPKFQLLLIKEYQRLKEAENDPLLLQWNVNRILSKVNYRLHTDAVKEYIVPKSRGKDWIKYVEEADLLNVALWGCTSKQWQDANPSETLKGMNLRDMASIAELIVLVNIESYNAQLIKDLVPKDRRFVILRRMAQEQLSALNKLDVDKSFRAISGAETKRLDE